MNVNLLFLGAILTVFGYLIAVKGRINFITFLRNRSVKDEKKVATLLGGSQFFLGAALIALGLIGVRDDDVAVLIVIFIILTLSVYVYKNYVD